MNYIERFFDGVHYVFNLNAATLSGAIDIIVVPQPDGSLKCTPFHVRFGKLQLISSREKQVTITVNGEATDLQMKLGNAGEAFFVDLSSDPVPEFLATSPTISPLSSPRSSRRAIEGDVAQDSNAYLQHLHKGAVEAASNPPVRVPSSSSALQVPHGLQGARRIVHTSTEELVTELQGARRIVTTTTTSVVKPIPHSVHDKIAQLSETASDTSLTDALEAMMKESAPAPSPPTLQDGTASPQQDQTNAEHADASDETELDLLAHSHLAHESDIGIESETANDKGDDADNANKWRLAWGWGGLPKIVRTDSQNAIAPVTHEMIPAHPAAAHEDVAISTSTTTTITTLQPSESSPTLVSESTTTTTNTTTLATITHGDTPSITASPHISDDAPASSWKRMGGSLLRIFKTAEPASPLPTPPSSPLTKSAPGLQTTPDTPSIRRSVSGATMADLEADNTNQPFMSTSLPAMSSIPVPEHKPSPGRLPRDRAANGRPRSAAQLSQQNNNQALADTEDDQENEEEDDDEEFDDDDDDAGYVDAESGVFDLEEPTGPPAAQLSARRHSRRPSITRILNSSSDSPSLGPVVTYGDGEVGEVLDMQHRMHLDLARLVSSSSSEDLESLQNRVKLDLSAVSASSVSTASSDVGPAKQVAFETTLMVGDSDDILDTIPVTVTPRKASMSAGTLSASNPSILPVDLSALNVELSLCGNVLLENNIPLVHDCTDQSREIFSAALVTYEQLAETPVLFTNPALVVRMGERVYPWTVALPMLVSLLMFKRPLHSDALENMEKQYAQPKRSRWSNWLWRSSSGTNIANTSQTRLKEDAPRTLATSASASSVALSTPTTPSLSSTPTPAIRPHSASTSSSPLSSPPASPAPTKSHADEDPLGLGAHISASANLNNTYGSNSNDAAIANKTGPPAPSKSDGVPKVYGRKTLRPTSGQLEGLRLRPGSNRVVFSVTSTLQGTREVSASIFLWEPNSRIVISDIDGTITKSDVFGQVMPIIGRDWTHAGVAQLYSNIKRNGYHIVYLTSRAIGQAGMTRGFINRLKQNSVTNPDTNVVDEVLAMAGINGGLEYSLPDGPVMMSPNRLLTSFNREVIRRNPEEFKIACLKDIRGLYSDGHTPFYAGFGNRPTDAFAYNTVGVPAGRIFTINSLGVISNINHTYKKSYHKLNEVVEEMFPSQNARPHVDEAYNDWNYWKQDIPTDIKFDF
eukprot:TRINITY_DN2745_c0_g1_i5.p1 TRINITY_DN2745_c0_g1~~TRINITY_DN2745_c0_g1_i5.p1  ORF type:complete len:1209 (-),score=333.80 TRINITY_DN2745_c0_g1_i5:62-3688(-)